MVRAPHTRVLWLLLEAQAVDARRVNGVSSILTALLTHRPRETTSLSNRARLTFRNTVRLAGAVHRVADWRGVA